MHYLSQPLETIPSTKRYYFYSAAPPINSSLLVKVLGWVSSSWPLAHCGSTASTDGLSACANYIFGLRDPLHVEHSFISLALARPSTFFASSLIIYHLHSFCILL